MLSIQLSLVAYIIFPSFCYAQYYYDDDRFLVEIGDLLHVVRKEVIACL